MEELIFQIAVLINSNVIKCDIKTNDDTIVTNITDTTIDKGFIKCYNYDYGISLVYIDNIKDIHITKL